MKLLSWNVNGIRAVEKKGFLDWMKKENADIVCLQETKAHPSQLNPGLINFDSYFSYWHLGEKRGYSGVGMYTKKEPLELRLSFGSKELDDEGRTMMADFGEFILFNLYCPNGGRGHDRVQYKLRYYEQLLIYSDELVGKGRKVIWCGDLNTAHTELDLARPKENQKTSGFLAEERLWIDRFIEHGYVDTFRLFCKEGGKYTWWDQKSFARDRGIGWRIDYFIVSKNFVPLVKDAFIESDVFGSDHCPVGMTLKF